MKIRSDFVTNSSSSSFIAVFAKIKDQEKADKVISKHKLEKSVVTGEEVLKRLAGRYWGFGADWAGVYIEPRSSEIKENSKYVYWNEYGGAGSEDMDFCSDPDNYWGELDYDVDLTDFPKNEQAIFNDIDEENGFSEIQRGYGAGRNG